MLEEIAFEALPEAMQTEVYAMADRAGGRIIRTELMTSAGIGFTYIVHIACGTVGLIASAMVSGAGKLLEPVKFSSMSYNSMGLFLEHTKAERATSI